MIISLDILLNMKAHSLNVANIFYSKGDGRMNKAGFDLTVYDVLKRPLFQKAKIVAGNGGLHRRVRWAHVLEISHFDTLIHGEELILSTGVGLHNNVTSKSAYLKDLIKHGVSCLCIELGEYFDSITDEMIEIANSENFPIIVFNETVRFIDITHDLHSLITNHHYKMIQQLEKISREFNRLTLTSKGILSIIKLLYNTTKVQVLYIPEQGHIQAHPYLHKDKQDNILNRLKKEMANQHNHPHKLKKVSISIEQNHYTILLQPVGAMGQVWAYLSLILNGRNPKEFELLILDRASLAISQDLLRRRYIEERKILSEQRLVADLIYQRAQNESEIRAKLGLNTYKAMDEYRVCLIQYTNVKKTTLSEDEFESLYTHYTLLIRSLFEKYGFNTLITIDSHQIIIIVIGLNKTTYKHQLEKVAEDLKNMNTNKNMEVKWEIGIGCSYQNLTDAAHSYKEAQYVIKLKNTIQSNHSFYDDIGIYRLLFSLESQNHVQRFVTDYLGPLIAYDLDKGSNLLQTLKVYLDNEGAVKPSADELFIVRQTIYHRLEKIKELIGDDFMSSEKKVAIQVALRAYQILYADHLLLKV